jgi:hypothetical protein
VVFPLIVILTVAATASPLPPPVLRQIDAGAGSGVCGRLAVHANAAIAAVLDGDATALRALDRLATVDLSGSDRSRRSAGADVTRFAADLGADADRGADELRRLSALASPDRDRAAAAALEDFSAALGESLATERGIAVGLTRVAGYIPAVSKRDDAPPTRPPIRDTTDQRNEPPAVSGSAPGDAENSAAQFVGAVAELANRVPVLRAREARAADHSVAAVSGC